MSQPRHREQHLEPLPTALLRKPLDYILADHLRQRVLCVLCERIAERRDAAAEAGTGNTADIVREVLDFIEHDMVVHVIDEEQDLFPLIRRRAKPDDDIEEALGQLSGEHADDGELGARIAAGLKALRDGDTKRPPAELAADLRAFAASQRQHLALENATVMPLARVRLTARDLEELAARMAARRGILFDETGKTGN